MNYQGHVEKGMVILRQPLPFPDGTPVVVEPISPNHNEFWRSASLGELAARQKVNTPNSLDELLGGWPADDVNDGFEQFLRERRERERSG